MAVRTALIRALEAEHFRVDSENGAQLTATYTHRRRSIQIAVVYTPTSYQITYLNSSGFRARTDARGQAWIHPRYQRHIDNLNRRVRQELERPAEQLREHQLAVARAQRSVVVRPSVVAVAVAPTAPVAVAPVASAGGYVAVNPGAGGAYVTPGVAPNAGYAAPPTGYGQPSCEDALADQGHPSTTEMFCNGVEPYCARELIYQHHAPSALMFCRDVDPSCAVAHLRGGGAPTALMRCR